MYGSAPLYSVSTMQIPVDNMQKPVVLGDIPPQGPFGNVETFLFVTTMLLPSDG